MTSRYVTARERLLARFQDETAGPPNGTEAAMRCTRHGRFVMWVSPPVPDCTVACPPECGRGWLASGARTD